ncbi:protein of unknown function [Nitrosomonas ureae]|uniref:DUF4124 domain-containing protein n=1 Tax=Nitrosomonas ureae TaxID=44577 RepID=A0A285BWR5_9PROT|nr:DUF4124 domain-containing protein [Nitrosomonas ureae]MBY0500150.1 DUF4124 domain-containing protein [Nitrosomonas sp.]SNX59283.1 protein of unknown function [Nitrosomonas ureae]
MPRNYFLFITLALFSSLSSYAGVYKHIDENGNVTYSNIPSNDSRRIDLPPIIVVPPVDTGEVEDRIAKRRESMKLREQREQLQNKIAEEEAQLNEVKSEYKDGMPDRLGSERNYQRYLNRVDRLREEISAREKNLELMKNDLGKMPDKIR